ncbi:unnamed protein product [Rhizopus stolonifer]
MNLPETYKSYKVANIQEGSRHFFSLFTAKHWDVENYFEHTYHSNNKSKDFAKIMLDYTNDLNWIRQLPETPIPIKEHIVSLLNQKKPIKVKLMSNLMNKKRRIYVDVHENNGGTIIVDMNEGTIVNGDQTNYHDTQKSFSRKREVNNEVDNEEKNEGVEEEESRRKPSTWQVWLKFLKENNAFHSYSPEANSVIRARNRVFSKPFLDRDLYKRHIDDHAAVSFEVPEQLRQIVSEVTETTEGQPFTAFVFLTNQADSKPLSGAPSKSCFICRDGLDAFREKIKQEGHDKSKFLEGIYRSLYEAYTSPFMAVAATCTSSNKSKIGFKTGQPQIESMSTQLKAVGIIVDDKSCYKTDGLLSVYGTRRIEMLLLETSCQFGDTDQFKIKFDHHKAMFGLLARIKTVASEYKYASIQHFSKCKFFFFHGAGDGLQLRSLVYQEGIFDFWQEATLTILPKFEDVDTFLPDLVKFF